MIIEDSIALMICANERDGSMCNVSKQKCRENIKIFTDTFTQWNRFMIFTSPTERSFLTALLVREYLDQGGFEVVCLKEELWLQNNYHGSFDSITLEHIEQSVPSNEDTFCIFITDLECVEKFIHQGHHKIEASKDISHCDILGKAFHLT